MSCCHVCRYLQEIGYTDTIIDVRSARIRHMLGLPSSHDTANTVPVTDSRTSVGGDEAADRRRVIDIHGNG